MPPRALTDDCYGTWGWLCRRVATMRRWPTWTGVRYFWAVLLYRLRLHVQTFWRVPQAPCAPAGRRQKHLYASAISAAGKPLLADILQRLGRTDFDYWLFVWDGARFDEPEFRGCRFVHAPGIKFSFFKQYLTPNQCGAYDTIWIWDDDIAVERFSWQRFLAIMRRNRLELAQPALSPASYHTYPLMLQHAEPVGRYVSWLEMFAAVFRADAWAKFWPVIERERNHWGWGYEFLMRRPCGLSRIGIVDSECVTHTKPVRPTAQRPDAETDMWRLLKQHRRAIPPLAGVSLPAAALPISYGRLREP